MPETDPGSFEEFVEQRLPALFGYARALTGDRREAEELVHEALVGVGASWRRMRRKNDPEGHVRAAMVRIMAKRQRSDRERRTADAPPEEAGPDRGTGEARPAGGTGTRSDTGPDATSATAPETGLAGRIVAAARARRRVRVKVMAAGLAFATGFVLSVPGLVVGWREGVRPGAAAGSDGDVVISRALPGGQRFRAMALGADGSVLGLPVTVDGEGKVIAQRGVWLAGPGTATPRRIQDTPPDSLPYLWAMATGTAGHVWPDGDRLRCLPRGGSGGARTLRAGWDGHDRFHVGPGAIVWRLADRNELAVSASCEGVVRTVPAKGTLEGFSQPYAYVRSGRTLWQVNVDGGQRREFRLPDAEPEAFAAGPGAFAWAGEELGVQPLASGARRQVVRGLPHAGEPAFLARLTVGEHLAVYSAAHQDREQAASLVYDLRDGRRTPVAGEAWAAGPYLLRQEGDAYRLTRAP
ncbi:sigma factor [Spirillospora sp. NPDC127200]